MSADCTYEPLKHVLYNFMLVQISSTNCPSYNKINVEWLVKNRNVLCSHEFKVFPLTIRSKSVSSPPVTRRTVSHIKRYEILFCEENFYSLLSFLALHNIPQLNGTWNKRKILRFSTLD